MSTINKVAHGLVAGQRVVFSSIVPSSGTGLNPETVYYVLAAGLTANAFQISETDGGTALTLTLAVTSANMQIVTEQTSSAALIAITALAATDTFTAANHGLVAGDAIFLQTLTGGSGLSADTLYYVIASGLTANAFKVATTAGGTAVDITTDLSAGFAIKSSVYTAITDPTDVMAPPTTPDAPTGLTITSVVTLDSDGHQIVEVKVAFTPSGTAGVSGTKIELTTTASGPDWTIARVLRAPLGTNFVKFQVAGNVDYSIRAAAESVYGLVSAYTSVSTHTAVKDTTAPATPSSFTLTPMILGVVGDWAANTELDLSHYELQVSDNSSFTNPILYTFKVKTNTMPINPLTATLWYARVRAVDTSGNASAYSATQSATAFKVGTTELSATAVINQATNLINGPASVTIDATGITILNGALILKDSFGASVMVASGFSGSWADFIATGLYNGAFKAGTAGVVVNGRTGLLPYWTVSNVAGSPVLTFLNPGIKFTFAAIGNDKKVLSDIVPILPGQTYEVSIAYDVTRAAGTVELDVETIKWDATLAFSTTLLNITAAHTATKAFNVKKFRFTAGSSDYFIQIALHGIELTSHSASNKIDVWSVRFQPVPGPSPDTLVLTTGVSPFTWIKPDNLAYIKVRVQGGGGGGGGAQATGAGQRSSGGGGGAGGYAEATILAELLPDSCTATIGGGGAGGVGAANGSTGSNSTFAGTGITTVQGNGGGGGDFGPTSGTNAVADGGSGGSASGGDINLTGGDGTVGLIVGSEVVGVGGGGGSAGGLGRSVRGRGTSGTGLAGGTYGGGGGGGVQKTASSAANNGGAGGAGVIIIEEHYI